MQVSLSLNGDVLKVRSFSEIKVLTFSTNNYDQ